MRVANPPDRSEIERFYSFDSGYGIEAVDGTDGRLRSLAARHYELVARHRAPGRLLDVGSGVGHFVAAARAAGWDAEGIDLNADVAKLARERGVPVEHGRIEDIAAGPASFDAVTMWDSLEHVQDPAAMIAAARLVLRPGGLLAISTPNIDGLYPALSYTVGRRTGYWTHPEPPAHLVQFSTTTLSRLLERAGFSVDAVVHERSPLKYTLAPGGLRLLSRNPGRALYAAAFLPALLLGPRVGRGDAIAVVAFASSSPQP